jgi:hypothetical protein
MIKKVLIGAGAFLLLIVIIIGVIIFLVTRPVQPISNATALISADNGTDKLANIQKQVITSQKSDNSGTMVIVITEDEANTSVSKLSNTQPLEGMIIKDTQMYFRDGFVEQWLKVETRGMIIDLILKYTIKIINGESVVTVQSVTAGNFPVPFGNEQLSKSLSEIMGRTLKSYGLNAYNPDIKITPGRMTITAATK